MNNEPKRKGPGRPPKDRTKIAVGDPITKLSPDAQRRQARGLSAAIQEQIPVEVFIAFHKAILQGRNPIMYQDDDDVWHLDDDPNDKSIPGLETKVASAAFLSAYGFGKPTDNIKLTAEMRSMSYQLNATVDDATLNKLLDAQQERQILDIVYKGLQLPTYVPEPQDVIQNTPALPAENAIETAPKSSQSSEQEQLLNAEQDDHKDD